MLAQAVVSLNRGGRVQGYTTYQLSLGHHHTEMSIGFVSETGYEFNLSTGQTITFTEDSLRQTDLFQNAGPRTGGYILNFGILSQYSLICSTDVISICFCRKWIWVISLRSLSIAQIRSDICRQPVDYTDAPSLTSPEYFGSQWILWLELKHPCLSRCLC